MPEPAIQADTHQIKRFIQEITQDWVDLDGNPMIEMRALGQTGGVNVSRFSLDWLDDAVQHATAMNAAKHNIYMCINPIDGQNIKAGRGATDEDVMAAFYCFADADTDGAMKNILSFAGPKFTMSVKTGSVPYVRGHAYWKLEEPVRNLDAWREVQKSIAATLKTDPVVFNPSRIMRVAGTVSWPNKDKQAKGYTTELVTMRTEFSTDRDPVPFERLIRTFPAVKGATSADAQGTINIDLGKQAMDRALAEQSINAGENWHQNVIRLVASYVSKGLADSEIHALTDRFTMPGYSVEDTRREVQQAIDGARAKGWTPEPDPIQERMAQQVPKIQLEPQQFDVEPAKPTEPSWPTPVGPINESALPKRRWVYGHHHIRKYVSVTASGGGIGKTSLATVECLAVATGRPLLAEPIKEQTNVYIVNLEDPLEEMQLRLAAAMKHYKIKHEDIAGKLFMDGEDTIQITLAAETREGITHNDALLDYMIRKIKELNIGFVVFDPFVSMHAVNENSNMAVQQVVAMLRRLARETEAAVHVVHHVRKGNGEDATVDSVRGAVSLIGAARAARVVNRVPEEKAIELGFPLGRQKGVFRVDDAKANLAPSDEAATYRQMVGVQLDNGEWVGVATALELPDEWGGMTEQAVNSILRIIAGGLTDDDGHQEYYSMRPQDGQRWAGHVIMGYKFSNPEHAKTDAQAKLILKRWLKEGLIEEGEYRSEKQRKDRKGIVSAGRVGEQ